MREILAPVLPCSSSQSCLEWWQLPFKIGITLLCYLLNLFFPLLNQKVSISFKLASSSSGLHVKVWNKSICAASLSNSNCEWAHKGKNIEIQSESVVNWLLVWSQLHLCLNTGEGWGHGADSWPQHAADLPCLTRACISCFPNTELLWHKYCFSFLLNIYQLGLIGLYMLLMLVDSETHQP